MTWSLRLGASSCGCYQTLRTSLDASARHCLHAIVSICSLDCTQSLERHDEIRRPGPLLEDSKKKKILIQHIDSYQITSSATVSMRNKLTTRICRELSDAVDSAATFFYSLALPQTFGEASLRELLSKTRFRKGMNLMLPLLAGFFTEWKMWRAEDIAFVAKLFSWLTMLTVWRWIFVKSKLQSWGSIAFGVTPCHFFSLYVGGWVPFWRPN